jgi:predicted phosphodiesterase
VLLCHGAPWDTDEYVYPEASDATFDRCAEAGVDFVIMGHTHCQLAKRVRDSLLINPGSVGQPRRGTGGAEWALLDLDTTSYEHYSESYDSAAVAARARATDPHFPFLQQVLVGA